MKLLFTKLPETSGLIEVSFNGGESYISYEIDAIRDNGIHLDDNQDYSKIQIKGKSGILKNLDIVKNIDIKKENVFQIYKTVKTPIFEDVENAEPAFLCYVNDSDGDDVITDNDDTKTTIAHRVVYLEAGTTDKFYVSKDAKMEDIQPLVLVSSIEDLKPVEGNLYKLLDNNIIVEWDFENNKPYDDYVNKRIRYPEGDLLNGRRIVGYSEENQLVDTVTEIIPSDVLEITYNNNGKQIILQSDAFYQAEPGKAIKSLQVVLKPMGFIKEPPSEAVTK